MNNIEELEKRIEYVFKDKELLNRSLVHRSFLNENQDKKSNERLEFLGDAVLELVTSNFLFNSYPDHPEGDLTSFRSALVRTESLAEEAAKIELGKYIFMSNGEESTGGRERPYILANTMEALIGAIYLDSGYDSVNEFITQFILHKTDHIIKNRLDIDSKSKLQELAQERVKITPTYELIEAWGPDHNKTFKMAAMIGEFKFGESEGDSKQNAEQNAAQIAIDNWNELEQKYFS